MWWGKVLVGVVGLLLFIATEVFLPGKEKNEKHFWATMIFIFSIVLGLPIEVSLEIQHKLDAHASNTVTVGRFQELAAAYDKNFGNSALPVLNGWANTTLNYLQESWNNGLMPLPEEKAADEIAKVYKAANLSIIATNVGSTKFYFGNQNYVDHNRNARNSGVPVVRFYLYSRNKRIEMRNGKIPRDIDEFFKEVQALNQELGSVYSLVIDTDARTLPHVWDVLIKDNEFGAQTEIADDWHPLRALATQDQRRLKEFRDYFGTLMGMRDQRYVVAMSANDVKRYFSSRFPNALQSSNPAEAVFDSVMESIQQR